MKRILLTGAAGVIGTYLRETLKEKYSLLLSDRIALKELGENEEFRLADLRNFGAVKAIMTGVDGIIHLGGISKEDAWDPILKANFIGTYNIYEAARKSGVRRIIFASSNHVVGFYGRNQTIRENVTVRPDSRYGVSKAFGEALGSLYADKYGLEILCIRIGNVTDSPVDVRRLATWISPRDLTHLIEIGLDRADLQYEIVYGMSDNKRAWWHNSTARRLGYRPQDRSEEYADDVIRRPLPPEPNSLAEQMQGGDFVVVEKGGGAPHMTVARSPEGGPEREAPRKVLTEQEATIMKDALLKEFEFVSSMIPLYRQFQVQLLRFGIFAYTAVLTGIAFRLGMDAPNVSSAVAAALALLPFLVGLLLLSFSTTEIRIKRASSHIDKTIATKLRDLAGGEDVLTFEQDPGSHLTSFERSLSTSTFMISALAIPAGVGGFWYLLSDFGPLFSDSGPIPLIASALGLLLLVVAAIVPIAISHRHETRRASPKVERKGTPADRLRGLLRAAARIEIWRWLRFAVVFLLALVVTASIGYLIARGPNLFETSENPNESAIPPEDVALPILDFFRDLDWPSTGIAFAAAEAELSQSALAAIHDVAMLAKDIDGSVILLASYPDRRQRQEADREIAATRFDLVRTQLIAEGLTEGEILGALVPEPNGETSGEQQAEVGRVVLIVAQGAASDDARHRLPRER